MWQNEEKHRLKQKKMIIHTLVIQSMLQYWPNRKVIQILLKVATQMEHKKDTVSTNVE